MHYSYFNYVFLLFSEGPERLRDLSKLVLAALGCKASSQELQVCALLHLHQTEFFLSCFLQKWS